MRRFVPLLVAVAWLAMNACGSKSGPCRDDYDCDAAQVCNRAKGECEPYVCREDADCLDPRLRCQDNSCVPK